LEEKIELERKTKEELKQLAQGLEISKISALKKEELIDEILKKREEEKVASGE
jgi:transcription termination factor Rho